MSTIADSTGFGFDPYDPELTEPAVWDRYRAARNLGGTVRAPDRDGFWLVTSYDEVRTALRDPATFSSASGHRIPTDGSRRAIPIDFDPPLHTAYRALMAEALSPARVRALRPFLAEVVTRLVDDFAAAGGGDFVSAVALPLPLQVLTELVGFSGETVAQFRALTEELWSRYVDADPAESHRRLGELMRAELADHRARPRYDFVGSLLHAEIEGRPIREDEQVGILATFAVAGHETTMNAVATLAWLLVEHPEAQAALRADPTRARAFVEEMLRHRSPAQNFARRATCPAQVGGTVVAEDDAVLLSLAAANRDPERFPDPDRFDPDRDAHGHLAFGWGIHQCIGAPLARTELVLLLEELAARPPLRAAGPPAWSSLQGGNHLGLTHLPLLFEEET
ncbi:cytochrome P450 [Pseudonocardia sp. NPDC049154]|uniref:cytochrome P450 n=1 Tax=Pseudonocardia sp. NPDC049154 TaxID=3155501 RepID=UPI0033D5B79C